MIVHVEKYNNNIDPSKRSNESRYLLSDYITREKKKISINGVQYEVTLYQGNHSNEYLISEMKGGRVEGRCQLFNRGILNLAWMMKNGKRIGEITEYENGKALHRESWNSLLGNEGGCRRMIENSKEGLIMTIRRKCERDRDGCVIYRGGFDKEMNRNGYGIEYDIDNGKEKIEGYWEKDKLIRMIREFDADNNQMIEYDENNSSLELLKRIPIYIGGYCMDNGKYVRNGVGYLIDKESRTALSESEWENGEEKKRIATFYKGWHVVGKKPVIRDVLKKDIQYRIQSVRNVDVPPRRIEINGSVELCEMDLKVEELVICSDSCNDLDKLDLRKFKSLQSLEIGDNCFESVQEFKINGLHRLKKLVIGENSFSLKWNREESDKEGSMYILHCESLKSIEIGEHSFRGYKGEFYLFNLPQLQSIHIGTIGLSSYNFENCSFEIEGIYLILYI